MFESLMSLRTGSWDGGGEIGLEVIAMEDFFVLSESDIKEPNLLRNDDK